MKETDIKGFHAHLYFEPGQKSRVEAIRSACIRQFNLDLGPINMEPVGPHPVCSTQLGFAKTDFERMFYWLMEHRDGLDLLIHPLTGNDVKDHTEGCVWIGKSYTLNLKNL